MDTVKLELDEDLVAVLREQDQPVERVARELIVLELYCRRTISGGRAAQLLGMERFDFIRYASGLGIPFLDMTEEEWAAEMRVVEEIVRAHRLSPTPAP